MELGKVNILFGKVVSVEDSTGKYRVKVSINGFTDRLSEEDLPYYFPWYGVNYLPQIDDIVPVIIFDDTIWNGFYGKSIDHKSTLSGKDYEHYLEIYKREVDSNLVSLSYKPSTGIEFLNGDSGVNIEVAKVILFSSTNCITITDDNILLGNGADKSVMFGEDTVEILQGLSKQLGEITKMFLPTSTFITSWTAACTNPFTTALVAPMTTLAGMMMQLFAAIKTLEVSIDKELILSKNVKIN